ncbi:MAG: phage holin family protein [Eggerthellaceae bacterium]|nr:phage holin family protein [Eggerthellaceae bacterium]
MRTFLTLIETTIAIIIAVSVVPGVFVSGTGIFIQNFEISAYGLQLLSLGLYALVLAIINVFIRPIVKVISFPFTIITFGLFALVINVAMLYLAGYLTHVLLQVNIYFASPLSAVICAMIISIVSAIFNFFVRK